MRLSFEWWSSRARDIMGMLICGFEGFVLLIEREVGLLFVFVVMLMV